MPGVIAVLKGLRAAADRHGRPITVLFVSASPPQIGQAIRDKLRLDGVPYDGIVFKDQLQLLRRGKFANLREHAGFKLGELFRGRADSGRTAREVLFGDDWEADPVTYSLYADVVAGRLSVDAFGPLLLRVGVDPQAVPDLCALAARVAGWGGVDRICINLERRTPLASFARFGSRLAPTFNYFQTALMLAADGWLDPGGRRRRCLRPGDAGRLHPASPRELAGRPGPPPPAVDLPRAPAVAPDATSGTAAGAPTAGLDHAAADDAERAQDGRRPAGAGRPRLGRHPRPPSSRPRQRPGGRRPMTQPLSAAIVVLVTAGSREEAETIGRTLVGERLAACVNVVGPIRSIYRWQEAVEEAEEHLLIVKARAVDLPALEARVRAVHSYDVPEVVALSVAGGSEAYLRWLEGATDRAR